MEFPESLVKEIARRDSVKNDIISIPIPKKTLSPEDKVIFDRILKRHKKGSKAEIVAHTSMDMRGMSFIWRPYFARTTTNVIFGDAGTGKSLLCAGLAGKWTTEGHRVLYINTEDNPETAFNPRLVANHVNEQNFMKICDTPQYDNTGLLKLIVEFKPDVIFFDMIKDMTSDEMDLVMRSGDVRKTLTYTNIIAEELNCCCIVTHHSNKAGGNKSVNRVQGTMDWFGKPRSVLEAMYDKKNQTFNVFHTKANNTRVGKGFSFKINDAVVGYDPVLKEDIVAPEVIWQDGMTMTEDDLAPEFAIRSKTATAKDAILSVIRSSNTAYDNGTKYIPAEKLRIAVTNQGINENTFEDARAELIKRGTIAKKKDGIWVYTLSDSD